MFLVFGRENCVYCMRAKALLESKAIAYNYFDIDVANNRTAFEGIFPGAKSVPQITRVVGGEYDIIGGYDDLVKFIAGQ